MEQHSLPETTTSVTGLCNQASFTKITLTEHLDMTSELTGIYETILDPTTDSTPSSGSAPASSTPT